MSGRRARLGRCEHAALLCRGTDGFVPPVSAFVRGGRFRAVSVPVGSSGSSASFDPFGALTAFEEPLPELGAPLYETEFRLNDLPRLRAAIRERAPELGLRGHRVADFVLVADELACNSVQHGGGDGRMALWATEEYAVCEVSDKGLITDPLAGRRRPDLRGRGPGAGLWSANQICELLLIRSTPTEGTAVRAYLDVGDVRDVGDVGQVREEISPELSPAAASLDAEPVVDDTTLGPLVG